MASATLASQPDGWDAFITHASADKPFVDILVEELVNEGLTVWYDRNEIRAHHNPLWRPQITNGIRNSARVVFVLTDHSNKNEIVVQEIEYALLARKSVVILELLEENPSAQARPPLTLNERISLGLSGLQRIQAQRTTPKAAAQAISLVLRGSTDSGRTIGKPRFYVERQTLLAELTDKIITHIRRKERVAYILRGPSFLGKTTLANDVLDNISDLAICPIWRGSARWTESIVLRGFGLCLIDGVMDRELDGRRDQITDWLGTVAQLPACFVLTCRTESQSKLIEFSMKERGVDCVVRDIQGLSVNEFFAAVMRMPSVVHTALASPEAIKSLHEVTAGVPGALQIIHQLIEDDPTCDLLFLRELDTESALDSILRTYQKYITYSNPILYELVSTLAYVPIFGLDPASLAKLLGVDRSDNQFRLALTQAQSVGFIQFVTASDPAMRCHVVIRRIFQPPQNEQPVRERQLHQHRLAWRSSESEKKFSYISRLDSRARWVELLFDKEKARYLSDGSGRSVVFAFVELGDMQQALRRNYREEDARSVRSFALWLSSYIEDQAFVDNCRHAIALAQEAIGFPFAEPKIGEAFASVWESAATSDCTVIGNCIAASLRHIECEEQEDKARLALRLAAAIHKYSWENASRHNLRDMLLAAFACGFARLGQFEKGFDVVRQISDQYGVSCSEAFGALLLGMDLHERWDAANSWLDSLRGERELRPLSLAPLFAKFLLARDIYAGEQRCGDPVLLNPDRAWVIAEWLCHENFKSYIRDVLSSSETTNNDPNSPSTVQISKIKLSASAFRFARR